MFKKLEARASMVLTTAHGSNLVTAGGERGIIPSVEYRVSIDSLRTSDYEAYLFIHQFQLPEIGHVLVLYRGHDTSARAVLTLLERVAGMPVRGFNDPDPAGVGILIDNKWFTHALIPDRSYLEDAPTLPTRFAGQLAVRPRIKEQCAGRSEEFRRYVDWIVDGGIAISQEWLCSHRTPIRLISL